MHFTRLLVLVLIIGVSGSLFGQNPAPPNIAAALTMKVVKYERNVAGSGNISVYVLGNQDIQTQFEKGIGKEIGSATLKSVYGGNELPSTPPNILFVGEQSLLEPAIQYAQEQQVLTVTQIPDLVSRGVALGIGVGDDAKPKIIINLNSSKQHGLDWNATIMKIAKTVE